MLDLAWSEILVVVLLAVVVIGPKELPKVMRGVGQWVRRMRLASAEIRRHFDDLAGQAELEEMRETAQILSPGRISRQLDDLLDPKGEIRDLPLLKDSSEVKTKPSPLPSSEALSPPEKGCVGGDGI